MRKVNAMWTNRASWGRGILLCVIAMSGGTLAAQNMPVGDARQMKPGVRADYVANPSVSWDSGTYVYDGAGNVIAIGDDAYDYDGAGRLTSASAQTSGNLENRQLFSYDQHGNITSVTTTSRYGTATVGLAVDSTTNQLTAPACAESGGCAGAGGQYDQAGNLVRLAPGGMVEATYTWDPLGALTEVAEPMKNYRYAYDASGERIVAVNVRNATRSFTLRGSDFKVAREFDRDASGTWQWRRDHVHVGPKLIAAYIAGSNGPGPHRHYHTDHLNTTRLVTDAAGYEVASYTYWPFGEEAPGSDSGPAERIRFTGHERDSGYGPGWDLDYMHARYYRPTWGRFLTVDPGRDWDPTRPQSWNLYTYVRNRPIIAVDPDGKQSALTADLEEAAKVKHLAVAKAEIDLTSKKGRGLNITIDLTTGTASMTLGGKQYGFKFDFTPGEAVKPSFEMKRKGTDDKAEDKAEDSGDSVDVALATIGPGETSVGFSLSRYVSLRLGVKPEGFAKLAGEYRRVHSSAFTAALGAQVEAEAATETSRQCTQFALPDHWN